jgi:hypothetical protein
VLAAKTCICGAFCRSQLGAERRAGRSRATAIFRDEAEDGLPPPVSPLSTVSICAFFAALRCGQIAEALAAGTDSETKKGE